MQSKIVLDKRQLIPRWHTSKNAFKLQYPTLINIPFPPHMHSENRLQSSIHEWQAQQTVSRATDLLIRLKHANKIDLPLFSDVSQYLLSADHEISDTLKTLVGGSVLPTDFTASYVTKKSDIISEIRKLKAHLGKFPYDPLSWMDLAFYYTSIAQEDKAKNCVEVACHLAPSNQFMIRSKSRFLVHTDQHEQAVWYLNRSNLAHSNPIIAAALLSISVTFELGQIHSKKLRELIEKHKNKPHLISDLAASYGTLEIMNGSIKKGKSYILQSLQCPSENALSQGLWLKHKNGVLIDSEMLQLHKSIEGDVTIAYMNKDFERCREHLLRLHAFQPFSEHPLVSASYISLTALDDYDFSINMSENRIPYADMHFDEMNNLAVAYLMKGDFEKFKGLIQLLKIKASHFSGTDMPVLAATLGLSLLLSGYIEEGKELYEKVLTKFRADRHESGLALASFYYSRAIKNIDPEKSKILREDAKKIAKRKNILELIHSNYLSESPKIDILEIPSNKFFSRNVYNEINIKYYLEHLS